jgi:hypothetical protein
MAVMAVTDSRICELGVARPFLVALSLCDLQKPSGRLELWIDLERFGKISDGLIKVNHAGIAGELMEWQEGGA